MKGAKIVIFVYDITRKETFEQLDFWFENTKEVLGNKPILGIVGNKSDLYIKEDVKEEVAEEYAKKKGVPFRLTSAKTPKNFCLVSFKPQKYLNCCLRFSANNKNKVIEGKSHIQSIKGL